MSAVADATVFPAAVGRDQADALPQVFDGLRAGQRLALSPCRYTVGYSLAVKNPQVVVSG